MTTHIKMDSKIQLPKNIGEKVKKGSHKSFMEVYEAFHHPLFRFICRYMKSEEVAEDLLHDTFMKLWETRERINPDMPIINYLYRICRNTVFNALKKQLSADLYKKELSEIPITHMVSSTVDDMIEHREYQLLLANAVDQLPQQRQRVFQLCRQQGKTYEEAANQLSISPYTVKEHMSLAMKSIREYMHRHADLALGFAGMYFIAQGF